MEQFWALLASKVYDNGWEAINKENQERRIHQTFRDIEIATVQTLIEHLRTKLTLICIKINFPGSEMIYFSTFCIVPILIASLNKR